MGVSRTSLRGELTGEKATRVFGGSAMVVAAAEVHEYHDTLAGLWTTTRAEKEFGVKHEMVREWCATRQVVAEQIAGGRWILDEASLRARVDAWMRDSEIRAEHSLTSAAKSLRTTSSGVRQMIADGILELAGNDATGAKRVTRLSVEKALARRGFSAHARSES